MSRIFSNGPNRDFVRAAFEKLSHTSQTLFLAAPYFNYPDLITRALQAEKIVQLLIGLNGATSPQAIGAVLGQPGASVRYFTAQFHAKIYIFENSALVGSANLTDAGMMANREAVVCLDRAEDHDAIEDVRALFAELWEDAQVLTPH